MALPDIGEVAATAGAGLVSGGMGSGRPMDAASRDKALRREKARFKYLLPHERPTGPQLPGLQAGGLAMTSVELEGLARQVLGPADSSRGGRSIDNIVRVPLLDAS